jgi:hypothetical protein
MQNGIYHKIHKYQKKLEHESNNSIYQYKLKYYYQMIGGIPDTFTIARKKDRKIIEVQYNDIRYTIRTYLENKIDKSIYKIINFGKENNKITVTIQHFLLNDIDHGMITHNINILKQYNVINCPKPICERNIWKKIYDRKLCSEIREEDGADVLVEYDIYQYFDDNGNQINLYLKDTDFLILLKQKFGDYIKYITFPKGQKLNNVNINFNFTFNENIVLTPTNLIQINKPPVPQKPTRVATSVTPQQGSVSSLIARFNNK